MQSAPSQAMPKRKKHHRGAKHQGGIKPTARALATVNPPAPLGELLPADRHALERARTQWQFGDWESLAALDVRTLESHPDRAQLAALVAAGQAQRGDVAEARELLRLALDWGVDRQWLGRVLISGVYNSLGRAKAVMERRTEALEDFESSIRVGLPGGAVGLVARGRAGLQFEQLRGDVAVPRALQAKEVPQPPEVGIVSYAQNFEDVMLWRALGRIPNGFYIDVGAWDPVIDSVSKAFYDHGWRGVHVEPVPEQAEALRRARPDELVIEALLGAAPGEQAFYCIPTTGLSTACPQFAEQHRQAGWAVNLHTRSVLTLAQVFEQVGDRPIHWLKIDVEGMEAEVLAGWGEHPARPWIVVIEATAPNRQTPTWQEWEDQIIARDYQFVYFDGLSRFYVHVDYSELKSLFWTPPNPFDKFQANHNHRPAE